MIKIPDNKEKLVNIITAVSAAVIFFVCTLLCPYLSDDWHFFFVWEHFDPINSVKRISSLSDIIVSMKNYYNNSGGRVIAHFLTYVIMTFDKMIFNILNAVVFVVFCYMLSLIAKAYIKCDKIWMFPLIVLMVFTLIPMFGDTMLWISGSVNYMWMAVPFLGCIYWLITRFEEASAKEKVAILPLFMFSAATNETTGGMLAVALLLTLFIKGKKYIRTVFFYIIALIPGMCLVLLAKGNSVRATSIEMQEPFSVISVIVNILYFLYYIFVENPVLTGIILFYIVLGFIDKDGWKKRLKDNFLFTVGICAILALTVIEVPPKRPAFWGFILFIPAAVVSGYNIYNRIRKSDCTYTALTVKFINALCITQVIATLFTLIVPESSDLKKMVLFLIIPPILLGIQKKFTDVFEKKLETVFQAILHNYKKLIPVMMIFFFVFTVKNIYYHYCWSKNYMDYQNSVIEYVKKSELADAYSLESNITKLKLSPKESILVDKGYLVEWIAAYYGTVTDDFVINYSPTKKEYLFGIPE